MHKVVTNREKYDVITPEHVPEHIPLTCPICQLVMTSKIDTTPYVKYGCCAWCDSMWIDGRTERWSNGWRPTETVVDMTLRALGMRA